MRAAQETCSRAGSIVDPDAITHPGPANAATTAAVLREVGCVLCAVGPAASPRRLKKAAGTVHTKHQTPANRENSGRLRAQREKSQRTPSDEA